MKYRLTKSQWLGNGWYAVEIDPYEYADFDQTLQYLCKQLRLDYPPVTEWLDFFAADLLYGHDMISLHMDNWTFSLATRREELRDQIFMILQTWNDLENYELA